MVADYPADPGGVDLSVFHSVEVPKGGGMNYSDGITPFVLAKIGPGAARHLFLTGERFDAETALRIGLVHEVADDVDAAFERVVGELLRSGPRATREAKQLVRTRPSGGEELARIAARLRAGDEGQDGLRAFLEKRDPAWASRSSS